MTMATIRVDLTKTLESERFPDGLCLGHIGEHNCNAIEITIPEDMAVLNPNHYTVEFGVGEWYDPIRIVSANLTPVSGKLTVTISQDLTLVKEIRLQVVAHDGTDTATEEDDVIAKSDVVSGLYFDESIVGEYEDLTGNFDDFSHELAECEDKIDSVDSNLSDNYYTKTQVDNAITTLSGSVSAEYETKDNADSRFTNTQERINAIENDLGEVDDVKADKTTVNALAARETISEGRLDQIESDIGNLGSNLDSLNVYSKSEVNFITDELDSKIDTEIGSVTSEINNIKSTYATNAELSNVESSISDLDDDVSYLESISGNRVYEIYVGTPEPSSTGTLYFSKYSDADISNILNNGGALTVFGKPVVYYGAISKKSGNYLEVLGTGQELIRYQIGTKTYNAETRYVINTVASGRYILDQAPSNYMNWPTGVAASGMVLTAVGSGTKPTYSWQSLPKELPTTATNGQIIVYNATSKKWVAQDQESIRRSAIIISESDGYTPKDIDYEELRDAVLYENAILAHGDDTFVGNLVLTVPETSTTAERMEFMAIKRSYSSSSSSYDSLGYTLTFYTTIITPDPNGKIFIRKGSMSYNSDQLTSAYQNGLDWNQIRHIMLDGEGKGYFDGKYLYRLGKQDDSIFQIDAFVIDRINEYLESDEDITVAEATDDDRFWNYIQATVTDDFITGVTYYELVDGEYVITQDDEPDVDKTYYTRSSSLLGNYYDFGGSNGHPHLTDIPAGSDPLNDPTLYFMLTMYNLFVDGYNAGTLRLDNDIPSQIGRQLPWDRYNWCTVEHFDLTDYIQVTVESIGKKATYAFVDVYDTDNTTKLYSQYTWTYEDLPNVYEEIEENTEDIADLETSVTTLSGTTSANAASISSLRSRVTAVESELAEKNDTITVTDEEMIVEAYNAEGDPNYDAYIIDSTTQKTGTISTLYKIFYESWGLHTCNGETLYGLKRPLSSSFGMYYEMNTSDWTDITVGFNPRSNTSGNFDYFRTIGVMFTGFAIYDTSSNVIVSDDMRYHYYSNTNDSQNSFSFNGNAMVYASTWASWFKNDGTDTICCRIQSVDSSTIRLTYYINGNRLYTYTCNNSRRDYRIYPFRYGSTSSYYQYITNPFLYVGVPSSAVLNGRIIPSQYDAGDIDTVIIDQAIYSVKDAEARTDIAALETDVTALNSVKTRLDAGSAGQVLWYTNGGYRATVTTGSWNILKVTEITDGVITRFTQTANTHESGDIIYFSDTTSVTRSAIIQDAAYTYVYRKLAGSTDLYFPITRTKDSDNTVVTVCNVDSTLTEAKWVWKNAVDIMIDQSGNPLSSLPYSDSTYEGKLLTVNSDGTAVWDDVQTGGGTPDTTGASQGDVLAVDSNGDAVWSGALTRLQTNIGNYQTQLTTINTNLVLLENDVDDIEATVNALDAEDIGYDSTETYTSGSAGYELNDLRARLLAIETAIGASDFSNAVFTLSDDDDDDDT